MELDFLHSAAERAVAKKPESEIKKRIKYHEGIRKLIIRYTPMALAIAFVIFMAVGITGYKSYIAWKYGQGLNNGGVQCSSGSDCGVGEICYSSRVCSPSPDGGIICGKQMGDLMCHRTCKSDADCALGQKCDSVAIAAGDVIHSQNICK